ncbi:MAG: hypothetical protein NVSMB29_01790 [Candidatus Dormibacteria bacterium]
MPDLAPLVTLIVLLELAVGTLAVTLASDVLGEVGRGFLGTTALICLALMGIELALAAALPDPSLLIGHRVDPGLAGSARTWSAVFSGGLLLYSLFCWVGTDPARRVVGTLCLTAGGVAVVQLARALGAGLAGGVSGALVAFLPATLLGGTALAGMLLGHSYLVAPERTFRPLRRAVYAVFLALGVQAAALVAVLLAGSGPDRHDLLAGRYAITFWLLVVGAGVVFTAAVNGLTLYFARIRANQPATAMLYVLIISVLMGVVPAHLLYFLTSVPV